MGAERVAAFLLAQDSEVASKLIEKLAPDVVAEVAEAMTRIDGSGVNAEVMKSVYLDLARAAHGDLSIRAWDDGHLQEVLEASVGRERSAQVLEIVRAHRVHERPFIELEAFPPERVHWILKSETPAVSAQVLAHVDPALSAGILALLEPEQVMAIVKRMATLQPPSFEVLRAICEDLVERLVAAGDEAAGGAAGDHLKTIADVLNFSTADVERVIFEGLEKDNADAAGVVREHMFTWEDIAEIDRRSMQKILGTVDTKTLSVALKASSPGVEANIVDNLSSRVADMVREERELAGPLPMSDVERAREEVMANVRVLIESGEFAPAKAGEDLVE